MQGEAATRRRVAAFLRNDYARVVAAVATHTGDKDRAEDAVQDAIVKALSADQEPEKLAGWITVVAINFIRQSWRRNEAQGRAYVRCATWDDPSDDESERTVDSIAVHEAIADLPERQRLTVVLHYLDGLSVAEIAETLGVSSGTVKTQLSRGREALAGRLTKEVA